MPTHDIGTFRSLDTMRLEARNATYPNTEAEVKAVTDREHEVKQLVAMHEDNLVTTAEAQLASSDRVLAQADEVWSEMGTLLTDLERSGARPGADLAARYERTRKSMALRIKELENVERVARFHAEKVSDPYGSLQELRRKYPQIVAGRRLT